MDTRDDNRASPDKNVFTACDGSRQVRAGAYVRAIFKNVVVIDRRCRIDDAEAAYTRAGPNNARSKQNCSCSDFRGRGNRTRGMNNGRKRAAVLDNVLSERAPRGLIAAAEGDRKLGKEFGIVQLADIAEMRNVGGRRAEIVSRGDPTRNSKTRGTTRLGDHTGVAARSSARDDYFRHQKAAYVD
jgi:hypothetical protein